MPSSTAQVLDGAKSRSRLGGEFCSLSTLSESQPRGRWQAPRTHAVSALGPAVQLKSRADSGWKAGTFRCKKDPCLSRRLNAFHVGCGLSARPLLKLQSPAAKAAKPCQRSHWEKFRMRLLGRLSGEPPWGTCSHPPLVPAWCYSSLGGKQSNR